MGVRGIEIPDMLWTERKGSMYLLEPELAADAVVGEDLLTTVAPEGGAQHFQMFQCPGLPDMQCLWIYER